MAPGMTQQLVSYCLSTSYETLPSSVQERAKFLILDELGCWILGSTLPPGEKLATYVGAFGGAEQSTVAGTAFRVPAPFAALANGTSAHSDELDGTHFTEDHPASIALPACLAVAEARGLSGKELMNALALHYDVGSRMVDASGGRSAMRSTLHLCSSIFYGFAGALAVGRLINLTADQMAHALALSTIQRTVTNAYMQEREHMSKAFIYGQGAYAAVSSALLAEIGMEGNDAIIETEHGIIDAFLAKPQPDLILAGLGEEFTILGANTKFYSAGHPIHAPLDAALELMSVNSIKPAEIQKILVHMTTAAADIVDERAMPSITLQDMMSVGMVCGKLDFEDAHDADNLRRPEVIRLRERIEIFRDPQLNKENPRGRGAIVELTLEDGQHFELSRPYPPGHAQAHDLTWDKLVDKFERLVQPRLGERACADLIEVVARVEDLPDVREITQYLRTQKA